MKRNIIYLLIFFLLLGIAYFAYDHYQSRQKKWSDLKQPEIFSFREKNAAKWKISYNNTNITCTRINGKWYITDPELGLAEQDEAVANVKNFNTFEYISTVGNTNKDLSKYGLDSAENYYTIYLKTNNHTAAHTFYQGNATGLKPPGYYIRYNKSPEIYHVRDYIILALQKELAVLPDKNLIEFEQENVVTVRFNRNLIRKKGVFWEFNDFPQHKIIMTNIDFLVHYLALLKAEKVLFNNKIKTKLKNEVSPVRFSITARKNNSLETKKLKIFIYKTNMYACTGENTNYYCLSDQYFSNLITNTDHYLYSNDH